jgi:anti-sigma factor RsiW
MSGKILRLDDSEHRAVDAVLPWFVNGTLEDALVERVERHLHDCSRCRSEVAFLKEIQETCRLAELAPDPTPAYHALSRRMARGPKGSLVDLGRAVFGRWRNAPRWARWTIAGQAAAVFALLLAIAPRGGGPGEIYQTLGAPARVGGPTVAVVFEPGTRESDLRHTIASVGARIVDGPTETHAYVLQVPAGDEAQALTRLRAAPDVVLAEVLGLRPDR